MTAADARERRTAGGEVWQPNWAVHPGDILGEVLDDQGLSRTVAALTLGWPAAWVDQVVDGKHDITTTMAADLERVFGLTAHVWLNMQARWDQHRIDALPPDTDEDAGDGG